MSWQSWIWQGARMQADVRDAQGVPAVVWLAVRQLEAGGRWAARLPREDGLGRQAVKLRLRAAKVKRLVAERLSSRDHMLGGTRDGTGESVSYRLGRNTQAESGGGEMLGMQRQWQWWGGMAKKDGSVPSRGGPPPPLSV